MGNIRKFLDLSRAEKNLLLQAFLALPLTRVAMRTVGMKRLQAILGRVDAPSDGGRAGGSDVTLDRALSISRIVSIAANRGLCKPTCLERSLALWWFLRRRGIESDLHIGVRPGEKENGLQAHAWIELAGRVLNDCDDVRESYAAFPNPI